MLTTTFYSVCAAVLAWEVQPVYAKRSASTRCPSLATKFAWLTYSLAVPMEFTSLAYWFMGELNRGSPIANIANVFAHGGLLILLLIDGFVIGKNPDLLRHGAVFVLVAALYCLWTAIHYIARIGSPYSSGDDIHEGLSWSRPGAMCMLCLLFIVIVAPLNYLIVWLFSLTGFSYPGNYSETMVRRRYLPEEEPTPANEMESSIA